MTGGSGHRASQRRRNADKGRTRRGQARSFGPPRGVFGSPRSILGLLARSLAMSARALTIQYSFAVPHNVVPPLSEPSGNPIPSSGFLAFPLRGGQRVFDYKDVVVAIQEARALTGETIFTPWRDAVGDREKGKDAKKTKATEEEEEEEDDEEGGDLAI